MYAGWRRAQLLGTIADHAGPEEAHIIWWVVVWTN